MKNWIGHGLIDSLTLDNNRLNYLFAFLISSTLWILIGGNIISHNSVALIASVRVAAASLGIIILFYSLSRHLKSLLWGLVVTYLGLWISVYSGRLGIYCLYIAIGGASLYSARHLRWEVNSYRKIIISGLIAALTILLIESAYTAFDMTARIVRGAVHQDTLFHASVASMIKNYGVISTGLNGLVPISYHVLSHIFFAALSLLSGVSVLETYGIAPWILFAPILIFSIASAIATCDAAARLDISRLWTITCLSLIVLPYLFSEWFLGISYFVSESYMISLGILVLSLPLLLKKNLSKLDVILTFLTAILITYAKGSVGAIYFGLWLTRLLFINDKAKIWSFLCFVMSGIGVYIIVSDSANNAVDSLIQFSWFHFFTYYTTKGSCLADSCNPFGSNVPIFLYFHAILLILGFCLAHFAPSFVTILFLSIKNGFKTTIKSPINIYIIAATFAGITIASTLAMPGGGVYYFTNVSMFIALPTLVGLLAVYSEKAFSDTRLNVLAISIIIFVKYPAIAGLAIIKQPPMVQNNIAAALSDMRISSSKSHVYLLENIEQTINPISSCAAQPFVYPALSERAWTGVINPRSKCEYVYYGYSSYNIPPDKTNKMPPPILLPKMSIEVKNF